MSEVIHKFQPNRTLHLRGFTDLGAAAALHSATDTSFKVSGIFRDQADFAVLVIWDSDNFFEHPSLKYLPDFDLSGLVLTFDVSYDEGLQPLDSPKFATIPWKYLEVINEDSSSARIPLFGDHVTQMGGEYTSASATFTVQAQGLQPYDRITLWYQNIAFDYIESDPSTGTPESIAAALRDQINQFDWADTSIPLTASSSGADLIVTAARPGYDGNLITLYQTNKTPSLSLTPPAAPLTGGSSSATWRIRLDFSALGIDKVRQAWLTFAPRLPAGAPFTPTEWEAVFSNWHLSGPDDRRLLRFAGPGSVRLEENDVACTYSGAWVPADGFFSEGSAKRATLIGDTVRIVYHCQQVHDLYVGTSAGNGEGRFQVQLDGDLPTDHSVYLPGAEPFPARRKIRSAVPPGRHEVTLALTLGRSFVFDFLDAAVTTTEIPEAIAARPDLSPALDYDTDHSYKVSPARLMWSFDRLGFDGPLNEYVGVFWWNQRKRVGARMPVSNVTFSGVFAPGDEIFLEISDYPNRQTRQVIGKSVFPGDTTETIAKHFEYFINSTYVGFWAAAGSEVLAITAHAAAPAYQYAITATVNNAGGSTGSVAEDGDLQGGDPGKWEIDTAQQPAMNRGARDWHSDLFRECAARGRSVTAGFSMELVFPPAGFGARYRDGSEVSTVTSFGNLVSTHCHFGPEMLAYQKAAYECLAGLQAAQGLVPDLQFGEFLWWFFTNYDPANNPQGGMAYYDPDTTAACLATLGRPLASFLSPDDDPSANGGADAGFLADRLRNHVQAIVQHVRAIHPAARFEVLYPHDVNYPQAVENKIATPRYSLGGRLNYAVNLPQHWRSKQTSGFDRLKVEALAFGSQFRNLDLARAAMRVALDLQWPADSVRYLVPVFVATTPWQNELRTARGEGLSSFNLWAYDHICLFGLEVADQKSPRRAVAFNT